MKLLIVGSKGHAVRDLQAALKRAGYTVELDGDFGPKTEAAVIALQTERGLVVDGIAGLRRWPPSVARIAAGC